MFWKEMMVVVVQYCNTDLYIWNSKIYVYFTIVKNLTWKKFYKIMNEWMNEWSTGCMNMCLLKWNQETGQAGDA